MSKLRNHAPFGNGPTRLKDVKTSACTSCYGTGFDVMGKPCSCKHLYIESDNMGTQVINEQFYTSRITTLQSENERLRAQVGSLLAVVAAKDEALKAAQAALDTYDYTDTKDVSDKYIKAERLCAEAIAFNPGDVELVEVGKVCFEDTLVGVDLTNANIKHDDKVYVLKQKEGE